MTPARELEKFRQSVAELEHALTFLAEAKKDSFYFRGIAKCFELSVEYAWKYIQRRVIQEGIEVFSPKEAVKAAGRLNLVDDVEAWLDFIENRNLAVHDYLGPSEDEFMKSIQAYRVEAKKLLAKK